MSERTKKQITEIFDAACIKQFESLGCKVQVTNKGSYSSEVMASYITAGSEDLTISLLLKTPRLLLAQTMPIVDIERIGDPEFQEDWNNELANRYLGRIKNGLLEHGCRLDVGLPEILSASDLKHFTCAGDEIVRHYSIASELTDSVMDCHLYIDIHNDALYLSDEHRSDKDQGQEGDLVIL
jgi:hypothetical protein